MGDLCSTPRRAAELIWHQFQLPFCSLFQKPRQFREQVEIQLWTQLLNFQVLWSTEEKYRKKSELLAALEEGAIMENHSIHYYHNKGNKYWICLNHDLTWCFLQLVTAGFWNLLEGSHFLTTELKSNKFMPLNSWVLFDQLIRVCCVVVAVLD